MTVSMDPGDLRDDVVVVNRPSAAKHPEGTDGDAINALRFLAVDAVEHAGSGHPGTVLEEEG